MKKNQSKKKHILRLAFILGALNTFGPFGIDMYLSGFDGIATAFHTSVAKVQITLSIYFLGLAVGQLIYGPLVDRFGRRKPLMIGVSVFIASSLLITVAPTINSLIFLRLIQALGGCSGMIIGRAVVRDLFDVRESASVLSLLAVVQGMGPIVAPLTGSFLLTAFAWHSVFIFTGIFGLCCLIAVAVGLPESLPPEKRKKIRVTQMVTDHFVLLRHRPFIVPAVSGSLAGASLFAYISGSPVVFMHIYGAGKQTYGLLFGCIAAGTIIGAEINRRLLRKYPPQTIQLGAMIVSLISLIVLLAVTGRVPMVLFMIPLWISISTIPMIIANSVALAMNECRGEAGVASAIIGLLQFGMASVMSGLVSLLHNGTAYPMAGAMLLCVLGGILIRTLGMKRILQTA